ncbi:MAG TPA: TnsA endonuclease N-terminal domain-containing protein [Puia sp.]|nr:TnsA endonuclease N-terminal domain-containing protein [Puia sp.]
MNKFNYTPALRVHRWGGTFDSLLELKYAYSIRKDYEFLRAPISIYYDPATEKPVTRIKINTRRYTPDFLIRHRISSEAFLVEIKPRAFNGDAQLKRCRNVADQYVRLQGFDWQFKVVFSDQVELTDAQNEIWLQFCNSVATLPLNLPIKLSTLEKETFLGSTLGQDTQKSQIDFVLFGEKPGKKTHRDKLY